MPEGLRCMDTDQNVAYAVEKPDTVGNITFLGRKVVLTMTRFRSFGSDLGDSSRAGPSGNRRSPTSQLRQSMRLDSIPLRNATVILRALRELVGRLSSHLLYS